MRKYFLQKKAFFSFFPAFFMIFNNPALQLVSAKMPEKS